MSSKIGISMESLIAEFFSANQRDCQSFFFTCFKFNSMRLKGCLDIF